MSDPEDSPASADVVLRLPEDLRVELKEPMGMLETDPQRLLEGVRGPLIAVGDIVTYHLETAGHTPDVSLIDERTKREPVDAEIGEALGRGGRVVPNPPGTLTAELLSVLREAIDSESPVRIRVDGEEDLAALPAIVAAPEGASVVYGQPGEGMVHVLVSAETRERAREFLERMEGDPDRALSILLDGAE